MTRLLIAAAFGFILGGLIRPDFDNAYWDWRYADYTEAAPANASPCELAEIAPTDSNLEACYGKPI